MSSRALLPLLLLALPLGAHAGCSASEEAASGDSADTSKSTVQVQLLAFNDFHGNLQPPTGSNSLVLAHADDPIAEGGADAGVKVDTDAGTAQVPTGGAAYLAAHVKKMRADNPNTIVVSSGDLTGASPLLSNLFKDEPTVEVMNTLGLDFEGIGNHEFDRGLAELVKLQQAAKYQYLAANVEHTDTKQTIFAPYAIREIAGVKIAFVGMTLKDTPSVTVASNVQGLEFESEAQTVNALVPELKNKGAAAIVVLLHQGGGQATGGTYDTCVGLSGDLLPVLQGLDPAIDVVASAHTHQAYDCTIDGRLVTSAASFGRIVTKIDLTIDARANKVVAKKARNVPVTHDVTPDSDVASLVATFETKAAPLANRVVGYVSADITANARTANSASCENPLGDVVADAQLEATRDPAAGGAVIALMNQGGIRTDLVAKAPNKQDGTITYAEAFAVQPFANNMVIQTFTGDQILQILDQQFALKKAYPLAVSKNVSFSYTWDAAAVKGTIDRATVMIDGKPIDPNAKYRVAANAFLAGGGDGFVAFRQGADRTSSLVDLDAFVAYLGKSTAAAPLAPPALDRIKGNGCAQ